MKKAEDKTTAKCGPFLTTRLRAAQIDILGAAICYADFRHPDALRNTPLGYWRKMSDDMKQPYLRQAQAIMALLHEWPHGAGN